LNVGCETPTKALSSKVVARKVLAIATAHTIEFLKVAIAIVRSSQRQHIAPSCASLYAPDSLNILQFAFLCNGSSILLTMMNGIEGVASEVISNYLPRSGSSLYPEVPIHHASLGSPLLLRASCVYPIYAERRKVL
jgi:hypothetical protein